MQVQFFKCTSIKHYWIIFYRLMEWNNIGLVLKNKGKITEAIKRTLQLSYFWESYFCSENKIQSDSNSTMV